MPIALKPIEIENQFFSRTSVLIVPCQVCPKMCLAAEQKLPYIDMPAGSRHDFFSGYIAGIRETLERHGLRSGIFNPPMTSPMMCLWPERLRNRLSREAKNYDAVAVIGCESATATARNAVGLPAEAVVQLMRNEGMANFVAQFNLPCTVELKSSPQGTVPWPEKIM
jgi:hypothetical protein